MTSLDASAGTTSAPNTAAQPRGHGGELSGLKLQFGLSYRVSAAARFDPPHELLGAMLTSDLAEASDVAVLIAELTDARVAASRSWKYTEHAVGVVDDRAVIVTADRATSLEVDCRTLIDILEQWHRHLIEVPTHLDRVSIEAAAAQRRIAALSWLESGVAVAAGHGWTVEAGQLHSIRNLIADGARTQNSTMEDAGASWHDIRNGLLERRPGDASVESIVVSLDQLLGA